MFARIAARRAERLNMPPSPTGWRCVGCNVPARPSVKCAACGVTVAESSPARDDEA